MNASFLIAYCLLLCLLSVYGTHRLWMVWTFVRVRDAMLRQMPPGRFERLPGVTIQLPMYNEANVAQRVIEAACRIDYPAELFQVQVLDDSTDASADIARACCQRMREAGTNIQYIHRDDRSGYKAGALANGLATASGEFVAVFDADFVPPQSFLRDTIHEFTDDSIGMVQTCWDHLNRNQSLLTQVQAMFLDGHFIIEQTARAAGDCWFNFNGTAGIWRRACIDEAGGWQHDTLTEDTDLSYRAQLAGWRFRYLPKVRCPAEIPPTISAFLGQQHRWNKGLIETGLKLLPRIMRSNAPIRSKLEAWFHLTSPLLYPAVLIISLLLPLSMLWSTFGGGQDPMWLPQIVYWSGLTCLLLGTGAATVFYLISQWARGQPMGRSIALVPLLMAMGVGTSMVNTIAVIGALLGRKTPFVRTPKFNQAMVGTPDPVVRSTPMRLAAGSIELLLASAMTAGLTLSTQQPMLVIGMPFVILFIVGFAWVGCARIAGTLTAMRVATSSRGPTPATAAASSVVG